jgi:hypothetical protein
MVDLQILAKTADGSFAGPKPLKCAVAGKRNYLIE